MEFRFKPISKAKRNLVKLIRREDLLKEDLAQNLLKNREI
jgi:hypothetical protein